MSVSSHVLALGVLLTALIKIVFVAILGNSLLIQPDEATYVEIVALNDTSNSVSQDRLWGLQRSFAAWLLPASWMHSLGLAELPALRTTSVLYALGSQLVFLHLCTTYYTRSGDSPRHSKRVLGPCVVALAILTLWPSLQIWSISGLRETSVLFWTFVFILGLFGIIAWNGQTRSPIMNVLFALIGIYVVLNLRPVYGVALGLAGSIGLLGAKRVPVLSRLAILISLVTFTFLLSPLGPSNLTQSSPRFHSSDITANSDIPANINEDSSQQASSSDDQDNVGIDKRARTFGQFDAELSKSSTSSHLIELMNRWIFVPNDYRLGGADGARTATFMACANASGALTQTLCEVGRLPLASLLVVIEPMFSIRTAQLPEWQKWGVVLENIGWAALVMGTLYLLVQTTSAFPGIRLFLITYGLLLLTSLAVFGGNYGTTFRHKAALLLPIGILIATARPRISNKCQPTD